MPGTARKRDRLIERARRIYASGGSLSQISAILSVDHRTLLAWKKYDTRRGISWDKERLEARDLSPERVLHILERSFARMVVEEGPKDNTDAAKVLYEQRLLGMIRVLTGYRKTAWTLAGELLALERFAEFCIHNIAPEDLTAVRRAVELFIEHLRKQNQ